MNTTTRIRLVTVIDHVRNTRVEVEGLETDRWATEAAIIEILADLTEQGYAVEVVEYDRTWGEGDSEVTVRFEDQNNDNRALRILVVECFTPTL